MQRIDYIPPHKDLKIIQDDEMFCINTDTEVLGEFLNIHRFDTVMDMGCNTGGLMLYASLFNPKMIIGLDINSNALKLCKKNMELNGISNFKLINDNLVTYSGELVDVLICNPPYFKTKEDNMANNEFKNLAKHECNLTITDLISSINRNLRDGGTLYFLYLTSRLDEVIIELKKNNLIIKEMKFVYDKNKDLSNVFILRAVKNAKEGMVVKKPIIIERQ